MDFKKKKKSLTLWPSKIGHVHLSGTAANSHQVPESWVCNWFKCSCSSEHGLILEANTKTMWVESAGHPCNLTNPRPVRKIHIHMLAHNARNSTESRKQPFGGSPLVSPCPHHSSLSCDFSSGSFVLLVLFLFNIRKEQVCSVQWSDPESRFPVQPYHSFAPLIGQQPQSLTIVIRRLFVDEWISQIAQASEEVEGTGPRLSSFEASSCDGETSVAGCSCCVRQSPGHLWSLALVIAFSLEVLAECPRGFPVKLQRRAKVSPAAGRWKADFRTRSGGVRDKNEKWSTLLAAQSQNEPEKLTVLRLRGCPAREQSWGCLGVVLAKLCKALLSWGWSLGQFLVGSAGRNTWVRSP